MTEMLDKVSHTVTLDSGKCKGCIACMKRCPTEAIRVRNGKARVMNEKCIGCGECVRVCHHRAKRAVYDPLSVIGKFKYKIALPPPSLFGQFNNLDNMGIVLSALKRIGFDAVFEVARANELVSDATRQIVKTEKPHIPIISTACPAILQLIALKYHGVMGNLATLQDPVDIAARLAREEAIASGVPAEDIGVFYISPCPAKVSTLKAGLGLKTPVVDGVLAASDIYFKLLPEMKNCEDTDEVAKTGILGLSWASSGGEAVGSLMEKYVAADGIENCMNVLRELEHNTLGHVEFIELNACTGGCVGGVLNIENPFVARSKIRSLRKYLPISKNNMEGFKKNVAYFKREVPITQNMGLQLDGDFTTAIRKMHLINQVYSTLPGLDCGMCGAPSCRALSEDIANGIADHSDCINMGR